jgi:phosphate transport system permease protein
MSSTFRIRRRNAVNNIMLTLTGVCAFITVSMLFVVLAYLVYNGGKSLNVAFFTKLPLPTGEVGGGMANAIVGSFEIILFASLIGLPIGFFTGIYLSEFGGKTLPFLVRYICDLLNGVPSIVIGIFVWIVVVAKVHHYSAYAGAIALSIMLIPITARGTEQFLQEVPRAMREGSLALGASNWRTIASVIVPAARKGILTGMILGVARISGETAPLLFTALNNQFFSWNLTQPTANLPTVIFNYALSAYDDWQRLAWAGAALIAFAVLFVNIIARTLARESRRS